MPTHLILGIDLTVVALMLRADKFIRVQELITRELPTAVQMIHLAAAHNATSLQYTFRTLNVRKNFVTF